MLTLLRGLRYPQVLPHVPLPTITCAKTKHKAFPRNEKNGRFHKSFAFCLGFRQATLKVGGQRHQAEQDGLELSKDTEVDRQTWTRHGSARKCGSSLRPNSHGLQPTSNHPRIKKDSLARLFESEEHSIACALVTASCGHELYAKVKFSK